MSLTTLIARPLRQLAKLKGNLRPATFPVPVAASQSQNQFRQLQTGSQLRHDDSLKSVPETLTATFIMKDGTRKTVPAKVGERALYLAHRHGIDMEVSVVVLVWSSEV